MVFQHGIGGSQDLPISLPLALAGGSAALTVSFAVLVLAWRRPRYDAATQGRPLPEGLARVLDGAALAVALRTVGLLFAGYVTWAAIAGPDNLANPTFGVVYVWLWVGLVPASLLLGPVVRALSPVRTLHRLVSRVSGGDPGTGIAALPRWVGLWPAALGLLAFVWLELVYPEANYLASLRLWFAVYAAVLLVGAAVFGDRWIAVADPFEVYSTLVSHLGVVGRREDGTLVWRSPLAQPGRRTGVAGADGGGRGAAGQHRVGQLLRLDRLGAVHRRPDGPAGAGRDPRPAAALPGGRAAVRSGHLGDGHLRLRGRAHGEPVRALAWCRSSSATSWPTT